MRTAYISALLWVMCLVGVAFGQEGQPKYQVMGIGGAGGMFVPSISPNDPKLMFIACDMSGTYRSTDGGQSWAMYHWKQLNSSLRCRPGFGKDAIYWTSGGQVKVSRDGGATWQPLMAGEQPWKNEEPVRIAVADGDKAVIVGTSGGLYVSGDAGKTWKKAADGAIRDLSVVGANVYALSANGLSVSRDGGKTWEAVQVTMPGNQAAFTMSGGSDGKETVLYVANKAGIAQSKDGGKSWQVVDNKSKCDVVLVPEKQTQVAWACQDRGQDVYVTKDGGKTWTSCFKMNGDGANVERSWVQTQLKWGYYISPLGLGIDPMNPQVAMISTQGDFYITRDGGKSWQQLMNKAIGPKGDDPGYRYQCNGLEVTSCWQTLFDPNDDQKMYIAYTDIGFSRSVDRGQTWISATEGCPWSNTYYQVAFDPTVKGKMYAACSSRHDIPHWTHIDANKGQQGGVCVSDNYGRSWKVLGTGLPKLPCTSIALDPKTSGAGLTMYVTLYEGGVYKSTDGGQTWQNKSNGLGNKGNNHAFMVKVHPKTGNLFCSITAFRTGNNVFAVPGGIWKSTDGGENWTDITKSLDLRWPTGFAFDPNDENIIYLAAATAPQFNQGGMYKTTDGGKTWKQMINDANIAKAGGTSYSQEMFVTLHPDHPDWVYLSSGSHGLWLSQDSGTTWKHFDAIPFQSITRLAWDPKDHEILYVTTFGGGVWKGPAVP